MIKMVSFLNTHYYLYVSYFRVDFAEHILNDQLYLENTAVSAMNYKLQSIPMRSIL